MRYRLKRQDGGSLALHDAGFGETMHPGQGPWAEAVGLYVEGSGLAARLVGHGSGAPSHSGLGRRNAGGTMPGVVVFDVGLGGAANALAAVECHRALAQAGRQPAPLHLVSFELEPEGLRFALEQAEALGYPCGHEATLEALLTSHQAAPAEGITWELRVGDFNRLVHEEPRRADIVFFDPFSPRANPELWSLDTLAGVYQCRRPGSPTVLVTYSSAFNARAAMLLAGFYVGEGPQGAGQRGGNRHGRGGNTTIAATDLSVLEQPLTRSWLSRWRRERDPWPAGTPSHRHRQLRTELLEHPQWAFESAEDAEAFTRAEASRSSGHPGGKGGYLRRAAIPGKGGTPPDKETRRADNRKPAPSKTGGKQGSGGTRNPGARNPGIARSGEGSGDSPGKGPRRPARRMPRPSR